MFTMQAYERGVPLAEELKLAPFCQGEFAATDISPAIANTATAALFAAFGQDQVLNSEKLTVVEECLSCWLNAMHTL